MDLDCIFSIEFLSGFVLVGRFNDRRYQVVSRRKGLYLIEVLPVCSRNDLYVILHRSITRML